MKGKPRVKQSDIERVLSALDHGHWIKGKDLTRHHRIPGRTIRAVAEQTGQIISGQKGYKLTSRATTEEREACIADLNSRARHLADRAGRIRNQAARSPITSGQNCEDLLL